MHMHLAGTVWTIIFYYKYNEKRYKHKFISEIENVWWGEGEGLAQKWSGGAQRAS